ncbi:MAG: hypothetical protein KKD38_07420 [Candidatus Delongbacteria bacterium]|nr:hypothetical protein [Candidatus Delongbacteria bacterium]MCG2760232.1 hypothetical protein [Candidatus Delongbacteria bacterium]
MYLKKIVYVLLSVFMCFSAEFTNVKGFGTGSSEQDALLIAKANALENAVGVFLSSASIMKNYTTISDNIIAKSNGFIKTYEVIGTSKNDDGSYYAEITADITDVVDQLVQDEMALKFLLTEMKLPSFAVQIFDNNGKKDDKAETSVKKYLIEKGMKLKTIENEDVKIDSLKKQGIDFVLKGNTDYAFISLEGVYNIKTMKSLQLTMNLELIDCATKEIVSTHSISSKKAHISENTAKEVALQQCGPQVAAYIINQAVKLWSDKLLE